MAIEERPTVLELKQGSLFSLNKDHIVVKHFNQVTHKGGSGMFSMIVSSING